MLYEQIPQSFAAPSCPHRLARPGLAQVADDVEADDAAGFAGAGEEREREVFGHVPLQGLHPRSVLDHPAELVFLADQGERSHEAIPGSCSALGQVAVKDRADPGLIAASALRDFSLRRAQHLAQVLLECHALPYGHGHATRPPALPRVHPRPDAGHRRW